MARRTPDFSPRRGAIDRLGRDGLLPEEETMRLARLNKAGWRARRTLLLAHAKTIATLARRAKRNDLSTALPAGFRALEAAVIAHPLTADGKSLTRAAIQAIDIALASGHAPEASVDVHVVHLLKWSDDSETEDAEGSETKENALRTAIAEAARRFPRPRPPQLRDLANDVVVGRLAYDLLVRHNTRLAISRALMFRGDHKLDLDDLVSEGVLGLMRALMTYDPDTGYALSSYAIYWIDHHVMRAVANNGRTVRIPLHQLDAYRRFLKHAAKAGPGTTWKDVAKDLEMPIDQIERLRAAYFPPRSIDAPVGGSRFHDGENLTLGALLPDPAPDASTLLEQERMISLVLDLLERMPNHAHRDIVRRRFYGDDSFEAIGKEQKYSRESIRQFHETALDHLRMEFSLRGIEF